MAPGWGGEGSGSKSRVPVSIDRRYASVDRIDNSIKCPHITLLIAPLSRDASRGPLSSKLSTPSWFNALLPLPWPPPRRTRLCVYTIITIFPYVKGIAVLYLSVSIHSSQPSLIIAKRAIEFSKSDSTSREHTPYPRNITLSGVCREPCFAVAIVNFPIFIESGLAIMRILSNVKTIFQYESSCIFLFIVDPPL